MNNQTINDAFAVLHVAAAAAALVFACRVLVVEVLPSLTHLRRLFGFKPGGGVKIVLQQAEALIERAKMIVRGFAVLWIFMVLLVAEIAPTAYALVTAGWLGVIDYYRTLPPTAVVFLLASLLPAAIIYWLPVWIEKKLRQYLDRYSHKIQQAIRKRRQSPPSSDDGTPRLK